MIYNYNKLTPFKKYIIQNFPYIDADFDSLNNYGLYCKVVEYLNKVIDEMNGANEQVEILTNAFNDLHDYVEDYFANLDVQEEINKKLDEMAEDGQLLDIISSYVDPLFNSLQQEVDDEIENQNNKIVQVEDKINKLSITPIAVSSVDDMTDTDKIYVNTTNGYWYYYDGSAWTQGSLYQTTGISNVEFDELDYNLKQILSSIINPDDVFSTNTLSSTNSFNAETGSFLSSLSDGNYITGYNKIDESLYTYSGFKVTQYDSAKNGALVIGIIDDDPLDYLFMIYSTSQTGSIYRVSHGTNLGKIGTFSNVSNTKAIEIISFDTSTKILTFDVTSTANNVTRKTYDLSSITDSITPIIGFTTFSGTCDCYYKLNVFPVYSYSEIQSEVNDLTEKFNSIDSIDYITTKGIIDGDSLNIKLLGDSITAGYGGTDFDDSQQTGADELFWEKYQNINGYCWANLLKEYTSDLYNNINFINYGVSGATSYNLVQYFESASLVSNSDDVVIVMIGTNDRNNTKANFLNNLTSLYSKITAMGKRCIFMGCIPTSQSNETYTYNMGQINEFIHGFCIKNKIDFISLYDELNKYCKYNNISLDSLLVDGLHPNDNGYNIMFQIIANKLKIYKLYE